MPRIVDRFWLWGHEAGTHNINWNLPGPSRITPVEAACYLGIPNVIMVQYGTSPWPPDAQYILPFQGLREVVWSVVGAGGTHQGDQASRVLELPEQLPNMTGVIMDDFFDSSEEGEEGGVLSIRIKLRTKTWNRGHRFANIAELCCHCFYPELGGKDNATRFGRHRYIDPRLLW